MEGTNCLPTILYYSSRTWYVSFANIRLGTIVNLVARQDKVLMIESEVFYRQQEMHDTPIKYSIEMESVIRHVLSQKTGNL